MVKALIATLAMLAAPVCLPYSYETGGTRGDEETNVYVNIQPDLGWKWNTKYPARFKVKFPDGKITDYSKFMNGKITTSFLGVEETVSSLIVVASFGLCTKTVCTSFRNKEFKINFGGDK